MNGIITVVCVCMNTHLASKELKTRQVIWIGNLSRDHYPEFEHLTHCLSLSVNLHLHLQLIYLAVSMVLSPQVVRDEKHKVDEALRYSKAKLAYTRTDERRKVLLCNHMKHSTGYNIVFQCLGKHPYPRHKFMPTKEL